MWLMMWSHARVIVRHSWTDLHELQSWGHVVSREKVRNMRRGFLKDFKSRFKTYRDRDTKSSYFFIENQYLNTRLKSKTENETNKCQNYFCTYRSSCPEVFCSEGVLRNFTIFIGKHLCQRPKAWNFIKKGTLAQLFSWEFSEISKNTFFLQNTSGGCFCIKRNIS